MWENGRGVRLAFWAVLGVALLLLLVSFFTASMPAPAPSPSLAWETGWFCVAGDTPQPLDLPAKFSQRIDGPMRLVRTLPADWGEEKSLYFKTNYQRVWASLDGVSLPVVGNWESSAGLSLDCASPWSLVRLPADAGGKVLTLTLSGGGSKRAVEVYRVLLGEPQAVRGLLLAESVPVLIICTAAVIIALGLLILAAVLSSRYPEPWRLGLHFLSAFILLTALWVFTDSDMQAVFFLGSQTYLLVNHFSYILLPIPFLLFVRGASSVGRHWIEGLCALACGLFVLNVAAMLLGRFCLYFSLTLSHVLVFATITAILAVTGCDYLRNRRSEVAEIFLGMCALSLLAFTQMAIFYLIPAARNTTYFALGALGFILVQALGALRRAFVFINRSRDFQRLIEAIPAGICRLRFGDTLAIELANDFYYGMFGYTRQEALDSGFTTVEFIANAADMRALRALIRKAVDQKHDGFEAELRHTMKDGSPCWILARGRIDPGTPGRITASVIDITDRKRADEQLRVSEEEYRIAVAHSGKMIHRYDIASRTLHLSAESMRLFGLSTPSLYNIPENPVALGLLADECIGDYRELYARIHRGEEEGTAVILRRVGDGRWRWHRLNYTLIRDVLHDPVAAVITFEDVTEQREKELAYKRWQQDYEALPPQSNNYYEYNLTDDAFEREEGAMLPRVPESVPRTLSAIALYTAEHCVCAEDRQSFLDFYSRERLLACHARQLRADRIEFRRLGPSGEPLWTTASVQLVADPYSSDIKGFILLQDVDREKREELERQARSSRDTLTGLYNREAFIERLRGQMGELSPNCFFALAIVDIDLFKQVNDTYGHQAGDAVLTALAHRLRAQLPPGDFCARLGGDEFFLALFSCPDRPSLQSRLTDLCDALRGEYPPGVSITVSLGAACHPVDGADFPILYHCADLALYEAKGRGKDRALLYSPDICAPNGLHPLVGSQNNA